MKLLGKFNKLSCEKTKFEKSWWGTLLKVSGSHSIFRSLFFNVYSRLPWLHNTYGFVNSQRQGIVHALVELMHNFCHLFGRPFTQKSVKPLFQSRLTISEEEKSMHILVTLFQCDNLLTKMFPPFLTVFLYYLMFDCHFFHRFILLDIMKYCLKYT